MAVVDICSCGICSLHFLVLVSTVLPLGKAALGSLYAYGGKVTLLRPAIAVFFSMYVLFRRRLLCYLRNYLVRDVS